MELNIKKDILLIQFQAVSLPKTL